MNTPNPLVPQGTFADKGKAQIRNTFYVILAGHVVLLVGLLFAGCNKKDVEMAGTDPALPQPASTLTGDWVSGPTTPTQGLPVANALPTGTPQPPITTHTPTPTPTTPITPPEPPATTGFTEHTVLKNETFSSIGQKYKVGYKAIAEANPGVDPTKLRLGQKIKIPPPRTTMTVNARTPSAGDGGGEKIHVVKSGDNLFTLAKNYGVTAKEIQTANNLPTTRIVVGQRLKIPGRAPPPVEATSPPPRAPPTTPALPDGTATPQPR